VVLVIAGLGLTLLVLQTEQREEARIGEALDQQKIANVAFADPPRVPVLALPRLGATLVASYALGIIAIFAGVADGHRFSMMFNTYTMSGNSRYSPGLILMRNIIDRYAGQCYRALDLGIGSDDYKRLFCKSDEPIFDSFIPLSLRGKFAAAAMSAIESAKHLVKHNPALFQMAQRLRSALR